MGNLKKLQTNIRLSILNPKSQSSSVFGKGIANLCKGVQEKGSLNAAAKAMGMAYSKAWRIIKDTEDSLGVQLLIRDGAHGSELTEEGTELLNVYLSIDEKISQETLKLYEKLTK